ncbi:hypothetical protein LEP1GSC125_2730 [Leptospira mayottensis 200901122]|uniref:Uncharacterized protein n=1 Tax=Leptospira mayottensis 200901122 TaxID=1193010 RepID=A0AA87MQJ6_9LEPT|nr:hypothetical protein LEP1GSC125_2730 [Leptospira mayottensis 200901122]
MFEFLLQSPSQNLKVNLLQSFISSQVVSTDYEIIYELLNVFFVFKLPH